MKEIPLTDVSRLKLDDHYDQFTVEMQKIFWRDQINAWMDREGFDPAKSIMVMSTEFAAKQKIPREMLPDNVIVSPYAPKDGAFLAPKPKSIFGLLNEFEKMKDRKP